MWVRVQCSHYAFRGKRPCIHGACFHAVFWFWQRTNYDALLSLTCPRPPRQLATFALSFVIEINIRKLGMFRPSPLSGTSWNLKFDKLFDNLLLSIMYEINKTTIGYLTKKVGVLPVRIV